jgi:hypothetical protein
VGVFVLPPGLLLLAATAVATFGPEPAARPRRPATAAALAWPPRPGEAAYVAVTTGLTAAAMWDPNHPTAWLALVAAVLTLPGAAMLFPLGLVLAAIAWNATGADTGGPAGRSRPPTPSSSEPAPWPIWWPCASQQYDGRRRPLGDAAGSSPKAAGAGPDTAAPLCPHAQHHARQGRPPDRTAG